MRVTKTMTIVMLRKILMYKIWRTQIKALIECGNEMDQNPGTHKLDAFLTKNERVCGLLSSAIALEPDLLGFRRKTSAGVLHITLVECGLTQERGLW